MSEHVVPSGFVHDLKPYPFVPEERENKRIVDPVGFTLSREQRGREQIIAQEMVKIVREEITKCYQREGVNHYQNCKHLTKQRARGVRRRTGKSRVGRDGGRVRGDGDGVGGGRPRTRRGDARGVPCAVFTPPPSTGTMI